MKNLFLKNRSFNIFVPLILLVWSIDTLGVTLSANVKKNIQQGLNKGPSSIIITNIELTPIDSLYKVTTDNGKVFYSSKDGQFIVSGEMFVVGSGEVTSLREVETRTKRLELLASIQDKDTIIYPAVSAKKHRLTIFTDVDCAYCAKLHSEVPTLNNMGIDVVYLAFPRAGINSPSFSKIASVWCSKKPKEALANTQQGLFITLLDCDDSAVKNQFLLGKELNIKGTPTIIFDNGKMLSGYYSANEFKKMLSL